MINNNDGTGRRLLDYRGFRLCAASDEYQFWSVVNNIAPELDGAFTDLMNAKKAIDLYLEREEGLEK
jgi:hypothetical protein